MKICIYGAGAIGGYLACDLARAGDAEITVIARGVTLDAIRADGIRLLIEGGERVGRPVATDDPNAAGIQDYVIIALKTTVAPLVVDAMQPLLGPNTVVVTAQNGIPWWYFHKLDGAYEGTRLEAVDPGGSQWDGIGPERALGCVVYPAAEAVAPGVIKHIAGNRFALGEPGGGKSTRMKMLADVLKAAGFTAPVRADIRNEIWVKLWGNLCFNPISALTGATLEQMAFDPSVRRVVKAMMLEAQAIGETLGVHFGVTADQRIDGAGKVGAHRTSMLVDLESGRAMEIDALVSVVAEMGRLVGAPTPTIDTVLALIQQRARLAGLYDG